MRDSSSERNNRPSAGRAPSTSKKFPVTHAARSRSERAPSNSTKPNAPWCASPATTDIVRLARRSSSRSVGASARSTPRGSTMRGRTIPSWSRTGSGRRRTVSATVNIATAIPMPRPRIRTAVAVNVGARRKARSARRRSCSSVSITRPSLQCWGPPSPRVAPDPMWQDTRTQERLP